MKKGFPGDLAIRIYLLMQKTLETCGSFRELKRSPGQRNGNLLQYSCLSSPMDRGSWQVPVHGVEKQWDMT